MFFSCSETLAHILFFRFRITDESISVTVGRLFLDTLNYFELYALYAKNKPKSDQLMREAGQKFFSSVKVGMICFIISNLLTFNF